MYTCIFVLHIFANYLFLFTYIQYAYLQLAIYEAKKVQRKNKNDRVGLGGK